MILWEKETKKQDEERLHEEVTEKPDPAKLRNWKI